MNTYIYTSTTGMSSLEDFNQLSKIIIDSGATAHMLPIMSPMFHYETHNGGVSLGDATIKLQIKGKGDTQLLNNVYHVPKLTYGLISIGKLDEEIYTTTFENGKVVIYNKQNKVLLTGTKVNKLYVLDKYYRDLG